MRGSEFKKFDSITNLRCYKCSYEFKRDMTAKDNFTDVECPRCKTKTVEINLGKR